MKFLPRNKGSCNSCGRYEAINLSEPDLLPENAIFKNNLLSPRYWSILSAMGGQVPFKGEGIAPFSR